MELFEVLLLLGLLCLFAGWTNRGVRALFELKQAPSIQPRVGTAKRSRISVLVPAKNEEKNIANCVRPLLAQLRPGDEMIVINNGSTDRTETILKELSAVTEDGGIPPIPETPSPLFRYRNTPPTPQGWTGKNFALHLGVQHASGDWFLFTDADTRHEPGSLDASVAFAEEKNLDLLTLLPRCIAGSFWERTIQPFAMAYMGLWFPVRKINDPESPVFFGNGQFLLMRATHYHKTGGHAGVKEAFLEDFAFMKKTKSMRARGLCAFGMDVYGTRMYDSFKGLWRGWRRIFLHAFEQRPGRILLHFLSVFLFSVLPFVLAAILVGRLSLPLLLCLSLLVFVFVTAFKAYSIVRIPKRYALLHPLAALIFSGILADAFRMAVLKHPTSWR